MADKLKLIRIGGTAYSGSTMLGLVLGNEDNGFYCGEVNGLYRPYREHHFQPECGCGDPACTIWKRAYLNTHDGQWLEALHHEVGKDFYIDSTKNYDWMYSERGNDCYDFRHIVLWKTPELYAASRFRRGKLKNWKEDYFNYYSRYFQLVGQSIAVNFSEFTRNTGEVLAQLCRMLEIPYFDGKEEYWNKTQHSLFGNDSAMIHTAREGGARSRELIERLSEKSARDDQQMSSQHRSIYVEKDVNKSLPESVLQDIREDKRLAQIVEQLQGNSACKVIDCKKHSLSLKTRAVVASHFIRKRVKAEKLMLAGRRTWNQQNVIDQEVVAAPSLR